MQWPRLDLADPAPTHGGDQHLLVAVESTGLPQRLTPRQRLVQRGGPRSGSRVREGLGTADGIALRVVDAHAAQGLDNPGVEANSAMVFMPNAWPRWLMASTIARWWAGSCSMSLTMAPSILEEIHRQVLQ